MGYVGIQGGEEAIAQAAELMTRLRTRGAATGETPLALNAIAHQLHFLHSAIISEGGLYDPQLAALAVKQSLGDPLEAAFFLRAYRCTRPRLANTLPADTAQMRVIRRISAAFKDVPGGQILGPTPDFSHRLFDLELIDETPQRFQAAFTRVARAAAPDAAVPTEIPKVLSFLRAHGLVAPPRATDPEPHDITREPLTFPAPRSAALAVMSRAQQGALLALAYSNMRGYGDIHPTVAELRVGYVPVRVPHPATQQPVEAGEVLMTECEVVAMFEAEPAGELPAFSVGYGACFGHNETKAIGMAVLDRALQRGAAHGPQHPSEDPEFVLLHVDGVDALGFCIHYKMPHYVTFQSDLDRLRTTQEQATQRPQPAAPAEAR